MYSVYWLRIDRKDTVGCAGSCTPQKFSRYGVVWVMGIRWKMLHLIFVLFVLFVFVWYGFVDIDTCLV